MFLSGLCIYIFQAENPFLVNKKLELLKIAWFDGLLKIKAIWFAAALRERDLSFMCRPASTCFTFEDWYEVDDFVLLGPISVCLCEFKLLWTSLLNYCIIKNFHRLNDLAI
jgi:hypothetical protein